MKELDLMSWDCAPIKTGVTANPAAGDDLPDISVPSDQEWLMELMYVPFNTAAPAANRYFTIQIKPDGTNIAQVIYPLTPQAGGVNRYYLIGDFHMPPDVNSLVTYYYPLGILGHLPPGAKISFECVNLQGADNLPEMYYQYRVRPVT